VVGCITGKREVSRVGTFSFGFGGRGYSPGEGPIQNKPNMHPQAGSKQHLNGVDPGKLSSMMKDLRAEL